MKNKYSNYNDKNNHNLKTKESYNKSSHLIELTEEQIAEFHEAFEMYDKDGSGSITAKELGTVLRTIGHNPREDELKAIIEKFDEDGSCSISFEEFLRLMSDKLQENNIEDQLVAAFRVFDRDGNGLISAHELRYVIDSTYEKLSNDEIEELIKDADTNGDGYINYIEFVQMMMNQ